MHISTDQEQAPQSVFARIFEQAAQLKAQLKAQTIQPAAAKVALDKLLGDVEQAEQAPDLPASWDFSADLSTIVDEAPEEEEEGQDANPTALEVQTRSLLGMATSIQNLAMMGQRAKEGTALDGQQ
jgi:hypothetical protein